MRRLIALAAAVVGLIATAPAQAGVYTDDLSKCIVKSTSEGDRTRIVEFIFAAMAADPAVKPMSNVTPQQFSELGRGFASLEQRLLFVDCRSQAVEALKYEGTSVIEASFTVLGSVAMRGLMTDPATQAAMTSVDAYADRDKWAAFFKEAGIHPAPAAQTPATK